MEIKQAVILAGGRGERLRPLTDDRPKPMVLVNGRPFLEYLVELLKKNGIEEIVMLLGYKHEKIMEHFGDGGKFGLKIKYSVSPLEDETGTRIRKAGPFLADKFLLAYSDNYWPLDLGKLHDFYSAKNVLASVTVYSNRDNSKKNNILVDGEGFVRAYDKSRTNPKVNGVDVGFFILDKKVLDLIPQDNVSFEAEILPKLIAINELVAYSTDEMYQSLKNPDTVAVMGEYLASQRKEA